MFCSLDAHLRQLCDFLFLTDSGSTSQSAGVALLPPTLFLLAGAAHDTLIRAKETHRTHLHLHITNSFFYLLDSSELLEKSADGCSTLSNLLKLLKLTIGFDCS